MKKIMRFFYVFVLAFCLVSIVACDDKKSSGSSSSVVTPSSSTKSVESSTSAIESSTSAIETSTSTKAESALDGLTLPATISARYELPATFGEYELSWYADVLNFVSHTNHVQPFHAGDRTVTLYAYAEVNEEWINKDFEVLFIKQDAAETRNHEFDEYCDQLFVDTLKGDPYTINFTLKYPEKFNLDKETLTSEKGNVTVEGIMAGLEKFNYVTLSFEQQIIYDTLYYSCEESVITNDYEDFMTSLGSYLGYNAYITSSLSEYHFYDEHDVLNYFDYLKEIKTTFEEIITTENAKIEKGTQLPDFILQGVVDQCQAILDADTEVCLIPIFDDKISQCDFLDADKKAEYIGKNKELVEKDYLDAYKYLSDEVTKLMAANVNANELGYYYLDGGADYYQALFQQTCGTTMDCEELIDYLENKLYDTYGAIMEVYDQMDANPALLDEEANANLMKDLKIEDILPFVIDSMKADFPNIGDIDYKIQDVPEALQENSSPAYYYSSVIDADVTESIFLNPADCTPEDAEDYETMNYVFTTLCHEGVPGHMYQNIYYKNSPYFSNVLATQSFSAYTEGWATYVEKYVWKYSDISQAVIDDLVLFDNYIYLIYCRCDVGINYEGWDGDDVATCFDDWGLALNGDPKEAGKEIVKELVEVPTNYLMYYFGYYQILDLRDYAQEALGDSYTDMGFHEAILRYGPAPWCVVQDSVNQYINATKAAK